MQYISQDDYHLFKCIAGDCPKSCCVGWQIVIDEETLSKYKNYNGDFRGKLHHGIDFKEGIFLQNNRRCAMLNGENLCDIQLSAGEDHLCYTCTTFPRHVEEFEDVRELSLSLSCPEAARMAVQRVPAMSFIETESDQEDDFENFDYLLYTKLVDAREILFKIVQNRDIPFDKRMAMSLDFAGELQDCLSEDRLFDMDDVIDCWSTEKKLNAYDEVEFAPYDIAALFDLERLEDNWGEILENGKQFADNNNMADVINQLTDEEKLASEQVLVLLIYTYFCGAVYDDWIYSKLALCVYSVQWIICLYKSQTNGFWDEEVLIRTVYSYAREIEHSDINLNALEDEFMNSYENGKDS